MISAKRIAVVHVARRQLGLTEEDYRALLREFGNGAESAKDLDDDSFERLMERLGAFGFRSTWKRQNFGSRPGRASPRQVALIRHLWQEWAETKDDASLDKWLESSFKVSALRFLTTEGAHQAISALRSMAARKKA